MDVPEIDGVVYLKEKENEPLQIGNFVTCKVVDVNEYDLICE